jgi:hypothetical protein
MTISLPKSHRHWLEDVATRNGRSVDDVIVSLIDAAREVESTLSKTADGPPAEPMTDDDWEMLHRRITEGRGEKP